MFRFLKTKVGFTLIELLVVVLIIGIVVAVGIPVYRGIAERNRIKLCAVQRREILAEVRAWCNDKEFNQDYTFTITSDEAKGTVVAEKLTQEVKKDGKTVNETLLDADILTNDILDGDVPFCPSSGTITVKLTGRPASIVLIEVSCDGGNDSNPHE